MNQGADLIAGRTQIGAGTLTTPTELLISAAPTATLGSTSIGEIGGAAFEGLLTVTAGTQLSVGNLSIATTGGANQRGAANRWQHLDSNQRHEHSSLAPIPVQQPPAACWRRWMARSLNSGLQPCDPRAS